MSSKRLIIPRFSPKLKNYFIFKLYPPSLYALYVDKSKESFINFNGLVFDAKLLQFYKIISNNTSVHFKLMIVTIHTVQDVQDVQDVQVFTLNL